MLSWRIILGLLALLIAWVLVKQAKLVFKFNAWMRDYVFSDQVILFSGKRVAILLLVLGVISLFSGVEQISRVQSLRPRIAAKIFNQAQKDFLAGDYDKVIQKCNELLKSDPANLPVLELLASTYLSIKQKEKAMECLRKILFINPNYHIDRGPLVKILHRMKGRKH